MDGDLWLISLSANWHKLLVSQGGSLSARSFDLARPGLVPPLSCHTDRRATALAHIIIAQPRHGRTIISTADARQIHSQAKFAIGIYFSWDVQFSTSLQYSVDRNRLGSQIESVLNVWDQFLLIEQGPQPIDINAVYAGGSGEEFSWLAEQRKITDDYFQYLNGSFPFRCIGRGRRPTRGGA